MFQWLSPTCRLNPERLKEEIEALQNFRRCVEMPASRAKSARGGRRGPRGRKMIQFDLDQVRMFGQIGLTDWEMAARTIERARKRH